MWIPSHQSLARHPKTIKLAKLLGVSVPTIIGHMHLLWWWCAEYAKDGDLNGFNNDEISEAMGWGGDEVDLVASLASVRFLDQHDGSYTIHNWEKYFGKVVNDRKANTNRVRRFREAAESHIPLRNGPVMVTTPLRNGLDKIRQDKKREEETREEETPSKDGEGVESDPVKKVKQSGRPGSVEEVKTYWSEKSLKGDPLQFYDHYDANGWMMGKAHIKSWTAAARNWSRNDGRFGSSKDQAPKAGKYARKEYPGYEK